MPGAAGTGGGCALLGLAEAEELKDGDGLEDAVGVGERPGEGVAPGNGVALVTGDGLSVAVSAGCSVEVNAAGQARGTAAAYTAARTASVPSRPMTVGVAIPGGRQCLPPGWPGRGTCRTCTRRVRPWLLPRCRAFSIRAVAKSCGMPFARHSGCESTAVSYSFTAYGKRFAANRPGCLVRLASIYNGFDSQNCGCWYRRDGILPNGIRRGTAGGRLICHTYRNQLLPSLSP